MWPFKKKAVQPTSLNEIAEAEKAAEAAAAEATSAIELHEDMFWVIELFDPALTRPENFEELIVVPPILYGPHKDPVDAMNILDHMLEALNAQGDPNFLFAGRIRPLFVAL